MDQTERLSTFFLKSSDDPRLGPLHIALYTAFLNEAGNSGLTLIIPLKARMMQHSKISSVVTYHRILRDLAEFGYLRYQPSFAPGRTRIELTDLH